PPDVAQEPVSCLASTGRLAHSSTYRISEIHAATTITSATGASKPVRNNGIVSRRLDAKSLVMTADHASAGEGTRSQVSTAMTTARGQRRPLGPKSAPRIPCSRRVAAKTRTAIQTGARIEGNRGRVTHWLHFSLTRMKAASQQAQNAPTRPAYRAA